MGLVVQLLTCILYYRILGCMWLVCRRSLSETVNKHYVQGCWHAIIASAGDNTTPICNDGVA